MDYFISSLQSHYVGINYYLSILIRNLRQKIVVIRLGYIASSDRGWA